jgi:hypothetical protein
MSYTRRIANKVRISAPLAAAVAAVASPRVVVAEPLEQRRLLSVAYPSDPDVVRVDVEYGAVPDDGIDDTAAIQTAINEHVGGNDILFFRNGVYDVSGTLDWKTASGSWSNELTIQGESEAGTIFRLADNLPAFASGRVPVLRTASANGFSDGGNNQAFKNYIRDLTVDVGSGNAGAVGIDYLVSNQGGIFNVTIDGTGGGAVGIDMSRQWPGPGLIQNVTINGFDLGLRIRHSQYGMTAENLTLNNQNVAGVSISRNSFNARNLVSNNAVPVFSGTNESGQITLVDSTLAGGDASNAAITGKAMLFVRNVDVSGYGTAINDTRSGNNDLAADPSGTTIGEYTSVATTSLFANSPNTSLNLPVEDAPLAPVTDPSTWADARDFGLTRNGSADDDTAALQAALNAGKETVYVPRGQYLVSDTLVVPAGVRRILFANTFLDASGTSFSSAPFQKTLIRVEGSTSDSLTIEGLILGGSFKGNTTTIQHDSTRPLVLSRSDLGSRTIGNAYVNTVPGGDVFFEDVIAQRIEIDGNSMWGRQINAEAGSAPQILNDGGTVWVLGFKTEGSTPGTKTINGGKTEILGGFHYPFSTVAASRPLHEVIDSSFSGNWMTNGNSYEVQVREVRDGVERIAGRNDVPKRGSSQENVPLFTAYEPGDAVGSLPWNETFAGLAQGATSDDGSTAWDIDTSNATVTPTAGVDDANDRLRLGRSAGSNESGFNEWQSGVIDISGQSVDVAIDLSENDGMEESGEWSDWIRAFYRLDSGPLVQFLDDAGDLAGGAITAAVANLTGSTLELFVRAKTTGESYYIEEVDVIGQPAAGGDWIESFNDLSDGLRVDTGTTAWTTIANESGSVFGVDDAGDFLALSRSGGSNHSGANEWSSESISLSGPVDIEVDVSESDEMEESGSWEDRFAAYYSLDGGTLVQVADEAGDISGGSTTYTAFGVGTAGQNLQVILRAKVSGSETYRVEEVRVLNAAAGSASFSLAASRGASTGVNLPSLFATEELEKATLLPVS